MIGIKKQFYIAVSEMAIAAEFIKVVSAKKTRVPVQGF